MSSKRESWIDTAKGIAIVLVVLGHVVSSYHSAGKYLDSTVVNFVGRFIYSFHMAVFMFLSGYLFHYNFEKTKKQQILQKLINYGIPYVVFTVLWWEMKNLISFATNSALGIKDLLYIPLYPISFMWYIYALLIMQVIQIIIGHRQLNKKIHIMIALIMYFIRPFCEKQLAMVRFSDSIVSDIMKFYVFFLIGVYFGQQIYSKIKNHYVECSILGATLLVVINILIYRGQSETVYLNLVFQILTSLIGICVIAALANWTVLNRALIYLGTRSLPIYVLQGISIAAARVFWGKVYHGTDLFGILPMIVCTFSGLLLPIVAYEISLRVWKFDFFFKPGKYIKLEK